MGTKRSELFELTIEWLKQLLGAHKVVKATGSILLAALWFAVRDPMRVQLGLDLLQTAVAAYAVWSVTFRNWRPGPAPQRALRRAREFRATWGLLWLAWCGLYVLFLVFDIERLPQAPALPEPARFWANLLNNLQTFALFLLAWIMRPAPQSRLDEQRPTFLLVISALVYVALLAIPELVWHSVGRTHPLVQLASGSVSGVTAGFALILLARRLENPMLKVPSTALGCLFFYAVIQPLFPIFRLDTLFRDQIDGLNVKLWIQNGQAILKFLAASFKIVLLWNVEKAIRQGPLLDYFEQATKAPGRSRARGPGAEPQTGALSGVPN